MAHMVSLKSLMKGHRAEVWAGPREPRGDVRCQGSAAVGLTGDRDSLLDHTVVGLL